MKALGGPFADPWHGPCPGLPTALPRGPCSPRSGWDWAPRCRSHQAGAVSSPPRLLCLRQLGLKQAGCLVPASQWALCATGHTRPLFCTQTPLMGHWEPAGGFQLSNNNAFFFLKAPQNALGLARRVEAVRGSGGHGAPLSDHVSPLTAHGSGWGSPAPPHPTECLVHGTMGSD